MKSMIASQVLIEKTIRFHKLDRYEMVEAGRWGPAWLHRLIIRMAMNCGMIRNAIGGSEVYSRHTLPSDKLAALHPIIMNYIDRGFFNDDDLVIYCGRSTWEEIALNTYFRSHYTFEYGRASKRGQSQHYLLNIPTFIIPDIEGMIVVPRPGRLA